MTKNKSKGVDDAVERAKRFLETEENKPNCRECIEKYGLDKKVLWHCPEGKTPETCEKASKKPEPSCHSGALHTSLEEASPRKPEIWSKVYRTWVCSWCRKHLADGDKLYFIPAMEEFHFCEDCKYIIENTPDFDEKGSKEKGTTSWRTAHNITLHRDDHHCRVCGEHWGRENPVEVHHIIPQKDGGSNNPKNLITLCERHHKETFANGYAGLKLIDHDIQKHIQKTLWRSMNG